MILVTGSVTARPETFGEVREISLEHVRRSRTEAGCISHAVHVDCENPLRLVFIEQWADRAVLAAHFAVPAHATSSAPCIRSRPARPTSRFTTRASWKACEYRQCIADLPYQFNIAMQQDAP